MASVSLSATVKKLAKDFALDDGHYRLNAKKMKEWLTQLESISDAAKPKTAQELIALAIRFEREGGETAAQGAAQLYVFAAGLLGTKSAAAKKSWARK